jgi:Protein of unknown function (DUF3231).
MGILSGNPKHEPMHYGEISGIWAFALKAKSAISYYQAFLNHAGDKDLQQLLRDIIEQARQEANECEKLLKDNGITPPPGLPERPSEKWEAIPPGARFSDQEIAATAAGDISMGLVACSTIMGEAIREDIAALFAKFHAAKAQLGLRALRLNKEKGWLIPPPLEIERTEEVTV